MSRTLPGRLLRCFECRSTGLQCPLDPPPHPPCRRLGSSCLNLYRVISNNPTASHPRADSPLITANGPRLLMAVGRLGSEVLFPSRPLRRSTRAGAVG